MKQTKQRPYVAVVMPAYNEEKAIGQVLKTLPKQIKTASRVYGIIAVVIDDCSKDQTAHIARAHEARVLRHVVNCGAGGATRTGLKYVMELKDEGLDIVYAVTIDSDGQHDSSDVISLVESADTTGSDMIIGTRLHEGNKEHMPFHRRLGNWGISLISRMLFGITVKDTQSGLRLYRAEHLDVLTDYVIDRYGFCTEILWQARRNKLDAREVPISVHYSEETMAKGQNNWGIVDLLTDLIWIRMTR